MSQGWRPGSQEKPWSRHQGTRVTQVLRRKTGLQLVGRRVGGNHFLSPASKWGGCWWEVGGGLTGRLPPPFPRPLPGRGWVSHGAHLSAQQVPRLPGGGDAGDTWGSAHAQTRGRGPDVLPGEPGKEPASGSFGIRQPRPPPSDHSLCARELGGESGGNVRPSRPSRA